MSAAASPGGSAGRIRPEHSHALVVGVERYDAGQAWDLDGPASDAARFTGWLLDRGVPADQVLVFLSPLADRPSDPLVPPTITVRPARRGPVNEALTRTLPGRRGDLLWLFWAGHGVLTRDESRRLFYTDASIDDKRNLDLTSLLTALRSDLYEGFPRQVAVVDACQNHVERLQLAKSLPAEAFAYGQPSPAREQFVLYAASPGQAAANRWRTRAGAFSEALLCEFAKAPADVWPPNMDAIAARLDEHFSALLEEGRADQVPTSFRYRTWSGAERVLGAAPGACGRLSNGLRRPPSSSAVGELVDRLLDLDSVADPVSRAAVIRQLRKGLATTIRYDPSNRVHVVNIVTRSLDWPGGLAELMAKVKLYADADDPALTAAEEAARRLAGEVSEEHW